MHACVLQVGAVTHHTCSERLLVTVLWSKPHPDGDPALEDCDFLARESCSLKRPGWWYSPSCQQGHGFSIPVTGQEPPLTLTRVSQQGVASRGVHVQGNTYFSHSKPLSDTLGHPCMTPMPHGQPSRAGDCWGLAGHRLSSQRAAPRPAPRGRRGLATLLLEAGEWVTPQLDVAARQPVAQRLCARQHHKPRLSLCATQTAPVTHLHIFTWGGMFSHSFLKEYIDQHVHVRPNTFNIFITVL